MSAWLDGEEARDRGDEAETVDRLRGIWGERDDQVRWHLYQRVKMRVAFNTGSEDAGHAAALAAIWDAARIPEPHDSGGDRG